MSIFKIRVNLIEKICCLLIAGLLFNQVYGIFHLHHVHKDGSITVEASYHPLKIPVKHSSDHSHGEEENQTDPHKYNNQIDLNLRVSRSNFVKIEPLTFLISINDLSELSMEKSIIEEVLTFQFKDYYFSFSIIRGPPLYT